MSKDKITSTHIAKNIDSHSFLNSPEAQEAKYEDEHNMAETIGNGSISDFAKWITNSDTDE